MPMHQDPLLVYSYITFPFVMMTSFNGNIFRVTGPLCGEFTGPGDFPTQRPVTRSFDVFLDLRLNKRLSKQPWGWWFETPSWSLWRHCNDIIGIWLVLMSIKRKNLKMRCRAISAWKHFCWAECGADKTRSILPKYAQKTPHSSPVRASHGVYILYSNSRLCSTFATARWSLGMDK